MSARLFFLSALTAAAFAGCYGDPLRDFLNASGDGGSVDGGATIDTGAADASHRPPPPDPVGGACTGLASDPPGHNATHLNATAPTPNGGDLVEGTYVLQTYFRYNEPSDATNVRDSFYFKPSTFQRARRAGTESSDALSSGTYAFPDATHVHFAASCGMPSLDAGYTATPTYVELYVAAGAGVDVMRYALQ